MRYSERNVNSGLVARLKEEQRKRKLSKEELCRQLNIYPSLLTLIYQTRLVGRKLQPRIERWLKGGT